MNLRKSFVLASVAFFVVAVVVMGIVFVNRTGQDQQAGTVDTKETTIPAESPDTLVLPPSTTTSAAPPVSSISPPDERTPASPQPNGSVYVDPAVEQAVRNEQDAAVIVELSVELSADEQRNSELLAEAKSQLVSELPEGSVAQVRQIGSTPFVALTVSSEGLDILSQSQSVESVTLDERFEPFWSDPSEVTGADPTAWARGYTGAGRSVAIIDTGVKSSHPYFGGRVVNGACFVSSDSGYSSPCTYGTVGVDTAEPCAADHPSCYHGTHVAGIAAGANGDSGINGVAKDAQIISVQVFAECNIGDCISASTADITAAFAWIFEEVKAPNPGPGFAGLRAVNLSLGGGGRYYGDCDGSFLSLKRVVDDLRSVGIATVVAAGNNGWSDAVSAPGCLSNVVTVGATQGATSAATGTRASYSNAGPQVDVLAPGSGILSSVGASSYGMTSGTSMAAPAVAGAIAAMEFGPSSADLNSVFGKLQFIGAGRTCVTSGDYARPGLRLDVMAGADRSPLPCAPSRPSVTLAGTSAVVSWQAPTSTGTSSLLDFSVSSSTGGLGCTAAGTSCIVPGLGPGSTYTFTVTARNASGTSPSSVATPVLVPGPNLPGGSPFGSFDVVSGGAGSVSVSGWAIDPETAGPIPVHVYIYTSFTDRAGYARVADVGRGDIGAVFPGYGPNHGFAASVPSTPGLRIACVFAINVGVGDHTVLGCKFVVVADASPFGSFDVVSGGAGSVSVSGWAIDPETAGPIPVHVYIYTSFTDRAGYVLTANQGRADIGAAFPGYGPGHGFSGTVPSSPGVRIACVFAINVGVGDHTVLGCKFVTVS